MSPSDRAIPPERIQQLLERLQDLSEDERALWLALAELDQEIGRPLPLEEQQLLQRLAASLQGYNPEEIRAAIRHLVRSQPQGPSEAWPKELRRRLRRRMRKR